MTDTISHDSATSPTATTTSEYTPCVRYGFPEESDHPRQAPTLQSIDAPIPDEAETASPVYLLTDEQYDRYHSYDNPYDVANTSCIATKFQNECEQTNQVVYPIHIESDAFPKVPFEATIQYITEFVEGELGCAGVDCTFYYSGNRSIHAHVPKIVTSEWRRKQLKERAAQFCDETNAKFDLGIYSRKRQFRLPGVRHQKTGLSKVEIEPEWEHDRIVQEAASRTPERPATYAEVLTNVFGPLRRQAAGSARSTEPDAPTLLQKLGGDEAVLSLDDGGWEIDTPLIEQEQHPTDPANVPKWAQYNYPEFSPYALASRNERSVAVVTVKGGAFARKTERAGATMIPAYFYGARGCNGEFTKADEHAPLQLSTRDFEKWDYREGDHVVIIGGQSRNSRIFTVESWHATVVGHALTGEEGSRQAALDYLEEEGYDVGKAGTSGSTSASNTAGTRGCRDDNDWATTDDTYDGLIYLMYWLDDGEVIPLYVGKAGKYGRDGKGLSANLKDLRGQSTRKFARWGDAHYYHIGNLSAVIFNHDKNQKAKYEKWANRLFEHGRKLRQLTYFWTKAWREDDVGPYHNFEVSLGELEYQIIGLTSDLYADQLLNDEGA